MYTSPKLKGNGEEISPFSHHT